MNLANLRPALVNIKPLLIKWLAAFTVLAIPVSIWSMNSLSGVKIVEKTDVLGVHARGNSNLKKKTKLTYQTPKQKRLRTPRTVAPQPRFQPVRSHTGNIYPKGQCTWYAKEKRPDLPNRMGNANRWVSSARKHGLPTGRIPKKGAIGQKGMHVVYVENVNPDGTMHISEMNYIRHQRSERTVATSGYQFIY